MLDTVAQLPPLLAALENNETGHISEWGVSYATMEEVRHLPSPPVTRATHAPLIVF